MPVKMVAVKKVAVRKTSSDFAKELIQWQHKGLLSALEAYKHEGTVFIITDYATATP